MEVVHAVLRPTLAPQTSDQASPIGARSHTGRFAERRRKGARFGEPDADTDLGYRHRTLGEESLRMLDAPARVVAVRRLPEGLLEGPAEMIGAETGKPGERRERNRLGEMLFDIGGD